ncbi:PAS domain S-box protein [Natronoarchaeum mannanilyticum]|uniref:histidine kinase n=1 Tax=Natronoarchaeum mannanilyticum TaxID=926360 RepID=A0AAV3TCC7_9EURY
MSLDLDSLTVVHVDDDQQFADLTKTYLEREDDRIDVRIETSPGDALDRIEASDVDCVVSDYDMPEMDGLELLEAVRREHSELPFILFTGKGTEEIASEAISAGVTDYLRKGGTDRYAVLAHRIVNAVEQHRARRTAERTQRRLRELAEETDDLLWMYSADWEKLLFVNSAYEDILGGEIDELREDPYKFLDAVHPDDRDRVRDAMDQASSGATTEIEYRVNADEGYERWVAVQVDPIVGDDGDVERIVGVSHEITERKRHERRLEALLDNTHQYVGLLDLDGTVLEINDTALSFTGEREVAFVDQPLWDTPWFAEREATADRVRRGVESAREGVPFREELTIRGDDREAVVDLSIRPVTSDEGEATLLVFEGENITERKKRTAALRRERTFIEQALDALDDVFYVVDRDGQLVRWNDRLEEVTGYSTAEIEGMRAVDFFAEDHRERIADAIETTLETGSVEVEAAFRTKDGDRIPHEFTGARLTSLDSDEYGLVGIGRDLRLRRRRERDRKRAQRRYRSIFEDPNILAALLTPGGEVIDVNPTAMEYLDWEREAVVGTHFKETPWWTGSTERDNVGEFIDRAANGEYVEFEATIPESDGLHDTVRGVFRPVVDDNGKVTSLIVSARDITEENAQERRFEAVFEDPKMLVGLLDPEGRLLNANETAMEYLDVDKETIIGRPFWETPWWSHSEELQDDVRELIARAANGEYVEYERDHFQADEHRFTVSGTIRPVTTSNGEITSLVASARDVTERKERERKLERYEALTEHASDIVTVIDGDGVIKYQSPSITDVLGYDPDKLVGEPAFEYIHPDDEEAVAERLAALAMRSEATTERITFRMRHADGSWRWIESVGNNRTDATIDGYVITSRDVTERKRRGTELKRKNEQLERFAHALSHDLRNPLNVLSGSVELAQETGDIEHIEDCPRTIDRMEQLIDDILTLAREGERIQATTTVDLETIAERCWETVETEDATLQLPVNRTVRADRSRLRQLLENLFRNAVEHGGNEITVEVAGLDDGFYVADDGSGIPSEHGEDVLRNGVSTDADGTGLGLAIVREIATAHGWEIDVGDGERGGARFEITGVESET